jgi:hypothetical protein
MKKALFLTLFIVAHIGFFFLQIQKQMKFIKASFNKQKQEQVIAQLEQQKQEELNTLYRLQNKKEVQSFASEKLSLKPMRMSQLHRVSHDIK